MASEQVAEPVVEQNVPKGRKKNYIAITVNAVVLGVIALAWILIRPGVFTIQPIGALPEGVTIIYHSRSSEMPFFSSPDGLCLQMEGQVTLFCRMAALGVAADLTERIIVRLPYSHWAYLRSTEGLEFDR